MQDAKKPLRKQNKGGRGVEIKITGTSKEIAALVVALQVRQPVTLDAEAIADAILNHIPEDQPLEGLL